jgi:carbon storage regulator
MVGEDVEIVITDVRGDRVRLGITAPKYVPVHRKEIYEAIHSKKVAVKYGSFSAFGGAFEV